jgi:pimeloyl-ACP methyl ester carboxylesterase
MMGWILEDLLTLIYIGLIALLIMALLSPLESLGWWAGWRQRARYQSEATDDDAPRDVAPEARHFVVFLSGIGEASGAWRFPEERRFLDRLEPALPDAVVIDDIFPYLVTSNALDEEQTFNRIWRFVNKVLKRNPTSPVGFLINLRNVLQVMVSVDHRYGPFYNLGKAETIAEALADHGYPARSGRPVTLVGYSGGGQVSVGAALYLARLLEAPIRVISVGGAICSDPGLEATEHLYHLHGELDTVDKACRYLFAGRWPLARASVWNRALARGTITMLSQGPVGHNGATGYFGEEPLADGTPRVDRTVTVVRELIEVSTPAAPSDASGAVSP